LIRIGIVAPAITIRAGLRALISDDPEISVIAEASSLAEMAADQSAVDVLVWVPAPSLDLVRELSDTARVTTNEETAMLLVTNDPPAMEKLTQLPVKAWGFLDPEATQSELIASIQALNEGLSVINPTWLNQVIHNPIPRNDGRGDLAEALTSREVEILQLLALGLTNKQIAGRLQISAHTVKFHVSTIFSKLGTTNRVETVNLGLKNGLIVL
jgi:DNA-binding NarL/FixJ family response regulator